MLTSGFGQVQPRFFTQIPPTKNSSDETTQKNAAFYTNSIIFGRSFRTVTTNTFALTDIRRMKPKKAPVPTKQIKIAIIVNWNCSRKDVRGLEQNNRSATPFTIFPVELQANTKQSALGPQFATSFIPDG